MRNGRGDCLRIVGIDEERCVELRGCARKARQNEHARVLRILRGNVFLGHEIHAVAQRCDQSCPR